MKSISAVICAFNEEKNVGAVTQEVVSVLEAVGADYEVILVDDGSKDGTLDVIRQSAGSNARIKIIVHPQNKGIGASLLDAPQYSATIKREGSAEP